MTEKELEQIYSEGYKPVYWTAMSFLKNEADAEDIVQEVFVTLIKSYETIRDKAKVLPWLKKTAANRCLDKIKLNKTDNMDDEFFDSIEALPEDFLPDSLLESDEARGVIMGIINDKLSEDIRRTLIMFYYSGMSTKEISEALGVPAGTVSWRISSAKQTIKKEVEKYEEKNRTKLFGMGLPFLTKLFMKEAEQTAFKPMPASFTKYLLNPSASAKGLAKGSAKKIAAAAGKAAKEGTGFMLNKTIIGGIAVLLAGTAAVVTVHQITKNNDHKRHGKQPAAIERFEEGFGRATDITIETATETITETSLPTDGTGSDEPGYTTATISGGADGSEGTSSVPFEERLDGPIAQMMYETLMAIRNDHILPDGRELPFIEGSDPDDNWFSCGGLNGDGNIYLRIEWVTGGPGLAGERLSEFDHIGTSYLYVYDVQSGTWTMQLEYSARCSYYYDLDLIFSTEVSMERGAPHLRSVIYRHNPETDLYDYEGYIESFGEYYPGQQFPSQIDTGDVYIINYPGYDPDTIYDHNACVEFYNTVAEGMLGPCAPVWERLSEAQIQDAVANIHR